MKALPPETERRHEEPFAIQFGVFMPNRVGQLCELLEIFSQKKVQVFGISVVDSTDWAVVRLIFDDPNKARELLLNHGLRFTESDVLLVELNETNALQGICAYLLRAEINLHFAYPLMIQRHNHPVIAMHVDELPLAIEILIRRGLTLIGYEDLADPL